jgi:hypothetical protein
MISRRGIAIDVVCALLVIPVWTFCGAVAAIATALALGLALRLVLYVSTLKPRRLR